MCLFRFDSKFQAVNVWAITNSANEFILVSGDSPEDRKLGLLCFSEDDADALLKQVFYSTDYYCYVEYK